MTTVNIDPKALGESLGKKGLLGEFKEFALRGNVLDLAVGIVIGTAFGAIVNSFVNDLIMPCVGFLMAGKDFSALQIELSDEAAIKYGAFLQTLLNFIIIALAVFLMVKVVSVFRRKKEEAPAGPSETDVLIEIRDLLKEKN